MGASAQVSVRVCLPSAAPVGLHDVLAVELRARGHRVQAGCDAPEHAGEGEAGEWSLSLEIADALADVWVLATAPDGEQRRARAGGPLDALDERALALTAASLLEEDLPVPSPPEAPPLDARRPLEDGLTAPEPSETSQPATTTEGSALAAAPVELVESSRALGIPLFFELGILTGLISGEEGLVGARFGVGVHLTPWLRFRVPLWIAGWPDQTTEASFGLGFDVVLALTRRETWLELGLAAKHGLRSAAWNLHYAVGPTASAALFFALDASWRIFVRAEGAVLFDVGRSGEPHYGLYLSSGFAVFL